jgi:hypothetical protein
MSSTLAAHVEDVDRAVVGVDVDALDLVVVEGVVVVDEVVWAVVEVELAWEEHPDSAPPMTSAPPKSAHGTARPRAASTTWTTRHAPEARRGRGARARLRS